jgi:hypothetical protein
MKVAIFVCGVFVAFAASAAAQDEEEGKVPMHVFGIGTASCAQWQSDDTNRRDGANWILGYWSASNHVATALKQDSLVGEKTDGYGIIAEVKKTCDARPSMKLLYAVALTYRQMRARDAQRPTR